jgi:hypothetical protein
MSIRSDFFTACATLVSSVPEWQSAAANGVIRAMDLTTESWETRAKAGALPCVAVDYQLEGSTEFGLRNRFESGDVTFYYIMQREGGVKAAEMKAEALRDALWPNGLTCARVLAWPAVRSDMSLPPNTYFANGNKPFVAAAVIAKVLIGATL